MLKERFNDRTRYIFGLAKIVLGLIVIIEMSGCTSLNRKFMTTMREDVGVFADNTLSMLSEADLGFERGQTVYLREYIDYNRQEEMDVVAKRLVVGGMLMKIINYSLELVVIAGGTTEEEKIADYADFVESMTSETREKLNFEAAFYDNLVSEVRDASTFRDALIAAQPIMQAAIQYISSSLDELDVATNILANTLEKDIDLEYDLVIKYQEALEEEKHQLLTGLAFTYKTARGDMVAYQELLDYNIIHNKKLIPKGEPEYEDMIKIGEYFVWRLDVMHKIEGEITPDWENYRAAHRELAKLHANAQEKVSRARAVSILWVRAHQKMAAGQTASAEWFDLKDVPTLVKMIL